VATSDRLFERSQLRNTGIRLMHSPRGLARQSTQLVTIRDVINCHKYQITAHGEPPFLREYSGGSVDPQFMQLGEVSGGNGLAKEESLSLIAGRFL
jgi:hypothetical protein